MSVPFMDLAILFSVSDILLFTVNSFMSQIIRDDDDDDDGGGGDGGGGCGGGGV